MNNFDVPVLVLTFNRPNEFNQVLSQVAKIKPQRLYIACDGARPNREDDNSAIKKIKEIIENKVDWKCELNLFFREFNLGCGKAVSGAIDWFFESEEYGIILEDDCKPHMDFFHFCKSMLERYKNEESVSLVSGTNYLFGKNNSPFDYHFSRYYSIWGWGTWRRSWKNYRFNLTEQDISTFSINTLNQIIGQKDVAEMYHSMFQEILNDKLDTWDIQWVFSCLIRNTYAIVPKYNLIDNIGDEGTHVSWKKSPFVGMPTRSLESLNDLKHPPYIYHDFLLDAVALKKISNPHFYSGILRKIRTLTKK